MSKAYINFTAEEFAEDGFFIQWIKHPDDESERFWDAFARENPDKLEAIEKARNIISLLNFKEVVMDESSYASMRDSFLLAVQKETEKEQTITKNRLAFGWKQLLRVAAVVLVLISSLTIYRMAGHGSSEPDQLTIEGSAPAEKRVERVNPKGQKSVLMLPDGSKVWLNVDSKLTYTRDFTKRNKREVHLDGEAFFNVVHNESSPFIVHTSSSIRIEVLGTSFNVKSYKEDQTVETVLVNGKVSIDKLEENGLTLENLILEPNQRAVYFKETNTLNVENVNAMNLPEWRHDRLVFDETPFRDVLVQLERWYDVKIHVTEEENLQCRLTAVIQNESLEDVLKLLEASHQIGYSIEDNEAFIYGKLCND